MNFLPHFPLHVNVIALFGLTMLLGLIGGELAKRCYFIPKISGYIAIGFLVGPSVFNMVTPSLLAGSKIFIDISLGLILFELGRHLDFTWLRHDNGILKMSLAESLLTFILVFSILLALHLPWLHATLAAIIAVATSPAVVMMVADDLSSKGPVTRRALILTSLNNLFGLILFTIFLPVIQSDSMLQIIEHATYRLLGSFILGYLIFILTIGIAYLIGKNKQNQFILFVGSVTFAIGVAALMKVSSMLTLFTIGVLSRNFNYKSLLTEVDFGWLAKLFFILLFVITGINLQLTGVIQSFWIILAFITFLTIGKFCGIWLFSRASRLTNKQTWAICLSLTPMAGLAVGMSNIIIDFNPTFGNELLTIITTVVAILNIIGPVATQMAFIKSEEALAKS